MTDSAWVGLCYSSKVSGIRLSESDKLLALSRGSCLLESVLEQLHRGHGRENWKEGEPLQGYLRSYTNVAAAPVQTNRSTSISSFDWPRPTLQSHYPSPPIPSLLRYILKFLP